MHGTARIDRQGVTAAAQTRAERPRAKHGSARHSGAYTYAQAAGERLSNFKNELRGCGPFLHDDPQDRPPEIFGGETTLHTAEDRPAYVLLPVIPSK